MQKHIIRCQFCKQPLSKDKSIARGCGDICAEKMASAITGGCAEIGIQQEDLGSFSEPEQHRIRTALIAAVQQPKQRLRHLAFAKLTVSCARRWKQQREAA